METNQIKPEPPLFVFLVGSLICATVLGVVFTLISSSDKSVANTKNSPEVTVTPQPRTYKMIGSPVIVVTSLSPDQASCLKGGGGLSCFNK